MNATTNGSPTKNNSAYILSDKKELHMVHFMQENITMYTFYSIKNKKADTTDDTQFQRPSDL